MKHVTHCGRQICFEETGSGEPVVLLPPGASPAVVWKDVAVILSARFRCLAVNFSGYGGTESFCKTRPMRLDDEVEAVFAVAEKFSKTVHIVGHSYGGAVALREREVGLRHGVDLDAPPRIAGIPLRGARRALRIRPEDVAHLHDGDTLTLRFTLASGSYASVFVEAVLGPAGDSDDTTADPTVC